ncbi:MAG: mannose-1-phosphate guanylyltransferase [Acidiferrobacteraceae bacterium]|nr:mannose-1-phosphate guanylyltransferase [Acidiferrobacteraceae bacterium]
MILAAGRGERLRPLTDDVPKALLEVAGQPLIAHHLMALASAGIERVVINVAYLADKIQQALGNGNRYGVTIEYSHERTGALETGGGIRQALTLLSDPFLVINGDVLSNFDFQRLTLNDKSLAHLVMIDNPPHNPAGDFFLIGNKLSTSPSSDAPRLTYAGIGLYQKALFKDTPNRRFPLAPLLREAASRNQISATIHSGYWVDVGTPARLAEARSHHELTPPDEAAPSISS